MTHLVYKNGIPNDIMFFERTNKNIKKEVFHMNIITQDLRFRQSVVKYYFRNYESSQFVDVIIKKFPFKIKEVQTDNGVEFTTRLQHKNNPNRPKTLFEEKLSERGIHHKMIKPIYTKT